MYAHLARLNADGASCQTVITLPRDKNKQKRDDMTTATEMETMRRAEHVT